MILIQYLLSYYYGLQNFFIKYHDSYISIYYLDNCYYLYEVEDLSQTFFQYQVSEQYSFFDSFILNRYFSFYTEYNHKKYVLLNKSHATFDYKRLPVLPLFQFGTLSWRNRWIQKMDYIEEYYSSIQGQYLLLDESFDYFFGLLQLAISYLSDIFSSHFPYFIQHLSFSSDHFYNPLSLTIDVFERDVGEVLKYFFFHDISRDDIISFIQTYGNQCNFTLVMARVLYPNYYFDLIDDIILGNKTEDCLIPIISTVNSFQEYCKFLFHEISAFYPIKKVSFLDT